MYTLLLFNIGEAEACKPAKEIAGTSSLIPSGSKVSSFQEIILQDLGYTHSVFIQSWQGHQKTYSS